LTIIRRKLPMLTSTLKERINTKEEV